MSRIVDIRHGRIAAACAHQVGCEGEITASPLPATEDGGAEIILFPRLHRSYEGRARKRLTRRFHPARIVAAE